MIKLVDEGTLDTVFACTECNEHFRYTFAGSDWEEDADKMQYDEFVDWCKDDIEAEHDCNADED